MVSPALSALTVWKLYGQTVERRLDD